MPEQSTKEDLPAFAETPNHGKVWELEKKIAAQAEIIEELVKSLDIQKSERIHRFLTEQEHARHTKDQERQKREQLEKNDPLFFLWRKSELDALTARMKAVVEFNQNFKNFLSLQRSKST